MHSLPLFVRLTGRNVILIGDGEAADAKRRLLDRAGAVVVGEDAPAALAIVAVEDDAEAEVAVTRLKARGILVNAVDRVALCDFTLPAIIDRDPVLIAIGTGGASAGLAKALRQRLESMLPQGLGGLANALNALRPILRKQLPDPSARRKLIDSAVSVGGPFDPLGTNIPTDQAELVEALSLFFKRGSASTSSAQTEFVKITSNDPDDLTLKQARLLASADRVYHDADIPTAILDRARADAVRIEGRSDDQPQPGLTLIITR